MTTSIDINTVSVKEAMSPATFTVTQTDKLDEVARIFEENGVHSAPVVDSVDRCVGIITSSDLVRFQSKLAEVNAQLDHGLSYEVVRNDSDGSIHLRIHRARRIRFHIRFGKVWWYAARENACWVSAFLWRVWQRQF